ncbi:MAG: hypothetical protein EB830_03690 [Nitrosopumilus sp. H13]|nr:MAG: hypothetical protein EB830_03690 [Nitrosopumilus sp. H13]
MSDAGDPGHLGGGSRVLYELDPGIVRFRKQSAAGSGTAVRTACGNASQKLSGIARVQTAIYFHQSVPGITRQTTLLPGSQSLKTARATKTTLSANHMQKTVPAQRFGRIYITYFDSLKV